MASAAYQKAFCDERGLDDNCVQKLASLPEEVTGDGQTRGEWDPWRVICSGPENDPKCVCAL